MSCGKLQEGRSMTQDHNTISRMRAITISREYGSGGGEIARRLAQRLNWQLIDHEVVVRVAQELGISVAEAEEYDEYVESLVTRILQSLQMIPPIAATQPVIPPPTIDAPPYHEACRRVIEGAFATGHTVIVGRGSQVVLAEHRDVLHVRIVAPLEQRITYVMRREGLNREDAQSRIQLKDQDRIRYLQARYHRHPADPCLCDIVLNTSVLDLDSTVDLLALALERKARRLTTPPEELGPAAGVPRYPEQPEDFNSAT